MHSISEIVMIPVCLHTVQIYDTHVHIFKYRLQTVPNKLEKL